MPQDRQFSLKLEGNVVAESTIPFRLLASILSGVQQTFYYIALAEMKRDTRKVGRIPADIQQACELRRVIEKPGSYEVVAEIADVSQAQLFDGFDLGLITMDKYLDLASCLEDGAHRDKIQEIIPDSIHRRRILRSIETYCPKEGDEWAISLSGYGIHAKRGYLNRAARKQINHYINYPEVETRTVTGELMRIHLDEHKLAILYPPTGRILDCFYDPEIEDFIIGNLKDVIQVTGRVQLDTDDQVEKIIDVREITGLDLSSVQLSTISSPDLNVELNGILRLEPFFEGQEIILELPELHIIAQGPTREEAIRSFEDDFVWLWKEYVLAKEDDLSGDAIDLKNRMLRIARQI